MNSPGIILTTYVNAPAPDLASEFAVDQLSLQSWQQRQQTLNRELDLISTTAGLGAALVALAENQRESGFIRDSLNAVQRFVLPSPANRRHYFSVQYNPARARRFAGAGVNLPPEGVDNVNHGCFLCAENIWWQQQGAELGYALPMAGDRYTAWMNPFPLAPNHCVIAAREHIPQCWGGRSESLVTIIADLLELSSLLPGWIAFYNGEGAGASILGHLHYHLLPRPPGYGPMPLELAIQRHDVDGLVEDVYPLSFMHWHGQRLEMLASLKPWINNWQAHTGDPEQATANIIAITAADGSRQDCYFIPRHKARSRAEGLAGVVGGFETLGEIVCSSDEDYKRLLAGEINFDTIAGMLRQVSVAL
ncbi:MAG: hypothetical protein EA370_10605 [Wenzhouxiangella sp.]|nr:MAG: hypothetical protein EA370_10605 [Wenzhouxiangella sp.]